MSIRYPVYQPSLGGNELEYVKDCIESTWISSKGKYVGQFEQGFADYIGADHGASVCNGTVAIHLALLALGVGPGDEVIVPTFTYIASVNAITYVGATPVFVDSLESTWQVDPADVERKITDKTRAIMAVHLYGHPCDMDELCRIADEANLFLIEDCAEAIGTEWKGQKVGTFGDISTFSFFGNKTITTGEGGMVVTNNETLHERSVHYKGQGLAKHREYWHDVIGHNFRMTNICAALGVAQLERIDAVLSKKRQIAEWYQRELADCPARPHGEHGEGVVHSYWMNSVRVEDPSKREPLRDVMREAGIETRPTFYPVHTMPMYASSFGSFPVAEELGRSGINVPSYPDLEEQEISEICEVIKKFYD